MTAPSVTLRFIRNTATNSSKTDDVLRITPSPSLNPELSNFVVKFSPAKEFAPGSFENQVCWTHEQVYEYVSNLLTLLTLDNDPFKSVQLDLPLAPSLLFEVATLTDRIPHILRFLYTTLTTSWPTFTKRLEPSTPVTYSYQTPARNETVQEEDDDMPPLIPSDDIYPCGSCPSVSRCRSTERTSRYRRHPRHTFYNDDGAEYYKKQY
jgi:hypothetical protein